MANPHGQDHWVAYTRLDRSNIYGNGRHQQEPFETVAEAEEFLDRPARDVSGSPTRREDGWMGPIPIVGLNNSAKTDFAGPTLHDRLSFLDSNDDRALGLKEYIEISGVGPIFETTS